MLFNSVVVNLIQYSHNYVTSHLHCIFTLVLHFYELMKLVERPIPGQFAGAHAIITIHIRTDDSFLYILRLQSAFQYVLVMYYTELLTNQYMK